MNPTFTLFFGYLEDTIPYGDKKQPFIDGLSEWCETNDDFSHMNLYYAANSLPVTLAAIRLEEERKV